MLKTACVSIFSYSLLASPKSYFSYFSQNKEKLRTKSLITYLFILLLTCDKYYSVL